MVSALSVLIHGMKRGYCTVVGFWEIWGHSDNAATGKKKTLFINLHIISTSSHVSTKSKVKFGEIFLQSVCHVQNQHMTIICDPALYDLLLFIILMFYIGLFNFKGIHSFIKGNTDFTLKYHIMWKQAIPSEFLNDVIKLTFTKQEERKDVVVGIDVWEM